MKKGDKLYVEKCPRENGDCDFAGEFERVEDDAVWFACPKCGWETTDDNEICPRIHAVNVGGDYEMCYNAEPCKKCPV